MRLADELRALIPDPGRVLESPGELQSHSRGYSHHTSHAPEVVILPRNTAEVCRVLRFAYERRVAVVPYGQGSSLEGQVVPVRGGIILDTRLMADIIELRPEDFIARVGPGLRRLALDEALRPQGLFLPPDPGWDASIGGMAATNAAGSNALRHGAMREHVLGLEVALAGGDVIRTGTMALKSSAGYDLTRLFVGSEGTLGVFTEITLRLRPLPGNITAARAIFTGLDDALRASAGLARKPGVSRLELLDDLTLAAVNRYSGTDNPRRHTLFVEATGGEAAAEVKRLSDAPGCLGVELQESAEERDRLWEARHHAGLAVRRAYPGGSTVSTDVAVPLSGLPSAIREARRSLDHHGFDGVIIAHAGDGNFHAIFPFDPRNERQRARAAAVQEEMAAHALSLGGTCSGEHGIGLGKREALRREAGAALEHMRMIKAHFDPHDIMNPGKIF